MHRLTLEGCHIADGINLRETTTRSLHLTGCYAGRVRLVGAKINGDVGLSGAHLAGGGKVGLEAGRIAVTGDMFCDKALSGQAFRADGGVGLMGASIGGQLVLRGAQLTGVCKGGGSDMALMAQGLTVTRDMYCDRGFCAVGGISLEGARIGVLIDEPESWPGRLELDGLTYGDLRGEPDDDSARRLPATARLEWLSRASGSPSGPRQPKQARGKLETRMRLRPDRYSPQPYQQLASYYRQLGYDHQAGIVLRANERVRNRQRKWWARGWGWIQDGIAGYGYAPGRAMALLTAALAGGALWFQWRPPVAVFPAAHPAFNAALYALDVLVPVAGLGQSSYWAPHGAGLWVAAGLHIFGWLLAITVVAAITRALNRN